MSGGVPNEGDWVLFRNESSYERVAVQCCQAERVTPKLVRFVGSRHPRQCSILSVVASYADKETAERMRDKIAGVAGEFSNRRRAAEEEKSRRVTAALEAAHQSIAKLLARGES